MRLESSDVPLSVRDRDCAGANRPASHSGGSHNRKLPRRPPPARGKDRSFVQAIARELSRTAGGTVEDHLIGARRVLEHAFRAIDHVAASGKPSGG